jgi:hypothetical protein
MKIKINSEDFAKCVEFAHECVNTNMSAYKRRNQGDKNKVISDISVGKIAEIAVHQYLINHKNVTCSYPDFMIYGASKKSFDADLYTKKYNIHVKSQDIKSSRIYGESWQFQKNDILTHSPNDNDLIILCIVNLDTVEIKRIIAASNLVGKYGLPKNKNLHDKLTLYYEDINIKENV